jgi:signal transduction histidine kinase
MRYFVRLWLMLSNVGVTTDMPRSLRSRIRISNQTTFIASAISITYFIYELAFLPSRQGDKLLYFYLLHLAVGFIWIPVFLMNKQGWHFISRIFLVLVISSVVLLNSLAILQPFRSEFYYFVLAAIAFVVFEDLRIIIPVFFLQAIAFLWVATSVLHRYPDISGANSGLIIRVFFFFATLFFILYFMRREAIVYQEEIKVKNFELAAERDELEKQNFTKDKIFSIISHDLRSPVASLHALLGLLSNKHVTEEEFKNATHGLEGQVEQLRFSLDELLMWSKSQLKGITPQPQLLQLRPVIKDVLAANVHIAKRKKLTLTTNVSDDLMAYCDFNMISSVISNLVTNAVKFTKEGGSVTVTGERDKDYSWISVEDTGVGISSEDLEKILNPHNHFTTRGTNNEKGTGLGLVMCNEFIEKNNGKLTIQSQVGNGSRFTVQLPNNQQELPKLNLS